MAVNLLWVLLAILGAVVFAHVTGAMNPRKKVNGLWLVVAGACIYVLAYRTWPIALQQVAVDIEGAMEDTEDIDRAGSFYHVGDSVVAVQQDADVPVWSLPVPVP